MHARTHAHAHTTHTDAILEFEGSHDSSVISPLAVFKEVPLLFQELLVVGKQLSPSHCQSSPTLMSSFMLGVGSVEMKCLKY